MVRQDIIEIDNGYSNSDYGCLIMVDNDHRCFIRDDDESTMSHSNKGDQENQRQTILEEMGNGDCSKLLVSKRGQLQRCSVKNQPNLPDGTFLMLRL